MAHLNDHLLLLDHPALLVGITGYMKLAPQDADELCEHIELVLRFLRDRNQVNTPPDDDLAAVDGQKLHEATGRELADLLAERLAPRNTDRRLHRFYRGMLRRWQPLKHKSLVVLSGLAPGADSIMVEVALKLGLRVVAPLPFPRDQYRDSSTFVWNGAPPAENEARQDAFDDLCRRTGFENCFHVPLKGDHALRVKERTEQTKADFTAQDETGKPRRHTRYYAAGEYLASYCHLLIAAWDGHQEDSREGTAAVVESRLQGPRPGVLRTTHALAMPHGGPLLHIRVRKATKTYAADDGLPTMRLLHPYSFASPRPPRRDDTKSNAAEAEPDDTAAMESKPAEIIAPLQRTNRRLQRERLATFFRLARDLERFNNHKVPLWAQRDRGGEFKKRLEQINPANPGGKRMLLPADDPLLTSDLLGGLRRVCDLRSAAGDATAWFNTRAMATLRWLFAMTLLAAVMLHVFAHWHPRGHKANNANEGDAAARRDVAHVDDSHKSAANHNAGGDPCHHHSAFRVFAGGAAFLLAFGALSIFTIARSRNFQEQDADARALSEGLRVQFYWNLAGLGQSVSANYMQRQRSELDWIRGAIRTASMPYHWWADQFRELPPDQQIAALRCVEGGWIAEQLEYFATNYRKRIHSLHGWHKLGFVLSLAGLFSLMSWWGGYWSDAEALWVIEDRFYNLYWAVLLVMFAAAWQLVKWLIERPARAADKASDENTAHSEHEPTWRELLGKFKPPERKTRGPDLAHQRQQTRTHVIVVWLAQCRYASLALVTKAVDCLTPMSDTASRSRATGVVQQIGWRLYNFVALLPLSVAIAAFAIFLALTAAEKLPAWPEAIDLGIIAGGVLLLCGALSIAWAEKNFDSELGYQYNTMAVLFAHASRRMNRQLSRLENILAELETANTDKARDDKQHEFDQTLHETQAFLQDLGIEALDENAEWLILHRARPLEPVMAG